MFIINFLLNTPYWVYLIFIALLFLGIKGTKTRTIHPKKLFMLPSLLTIYILSTINEGYLALTYIIFAFMGSNVGYKLALRENVQYINCSTITINGNYQMLIIAMCFFIIKCYLGYMMAVAPTNWIFSFLDLAVSASVSSFFLGKAYCHYKAASALND